MAPSSRPSVSLGAGARRRGARSRRVSAVAVMITVLVLGGAVAAVYTTGVRLGARIAPAPDGAAAAAPSSTPAGGSRPGSTSTEAGRGDDETEEAALPDRAESPTTVGTEPDPSTTVGGSRPADDADLDGVEATEPYAGVWPYASWREVVAHTVRGDGRFRTPSDAALRFASEVVGMAGATVGEVVEDGAVATVEIRSGRGATLVSLTRATPGRTSAATPWSVVDATGAARLDAPEAVSGTARVGTTGRPGVVGIHDRTRWRGIGVAPASGAAFDVRLDPGAAGPAIAIALAGDPRAPSSFTARGVQLSGGSAAPAAPADPLVATRALVAAVGAGDVGATWELLDPAARGAVLDWRGLAGRIPDLRQRLAAFGTGSPTATSVTTPAGAVSVVAPAAPAGGAAGPLAALVFRMDGGRARLASTEAGPVDWIGPTQADPTLLASGPTRPLALVVDGSVWSSTPDGATGLRGSASGLAAGPHLAIAISVQGEQVTASAFPFTVTAPAAPTVPAAPTDSSDDPAPAAGPAPGPSPESPRSTEVPSEASAAPQAPSTTRVPATTVPA